MKNGPAADAIYIGKPKPLARADLDRLKEGGRNPQGTIARIRDSHHMIARLTALGLKPKVIAERLGMSRTRVTQLQGAPAMVELIARYRERVDEQFDSNADAFFETASQNMLAAQRHIADRFAELDEEGELMPVREALAVASDAADRVGYGKRSTNVNINMDFAAQLERAIDRSSKARIINATAEVEPKKLVVQPRSSQTPPTPRVEAQPQPFLRRRA